MSCLGGCAGQEEALAADVAGELEGDTFDLAGYAAHDARKNVLVHSLLSRLRQRFRLQVRHDADSRGRKTRVGNLKLRRLGTWARGSMLGSRRSSLYDSWAASRRSSAASSRRSSFDEDETEIRDHNA